ncbi:MAG TPA: hypothetical protein VIG05_00610 [Candidatus Nitrosotenuis sp.]
MAKKRVTITIDKEIDEKIHRLQAEFISKSSRNWSFSSVLSVIIEEGMKTLNNKTKNLKEEKRLQRHAN